MGILSPCTNLPAPIYFCHHNLPHSFDWHLPLDLSQRNWLVIWSSWVYWLDQIGAKDWCIDNNQMFVIYLFVYHHTINSSFTQSLTYGTNTKLIASIDGWGWKVSAHLTKSIIKAVVAAMTGATNTHRLAKKHSQNQVLTFFYWTQVCVMVQWWWPVEEPNLKEIIQVSLHIKRLVLLYQRSWWLLRCSQLVLNHQK